MSKRKPPTPDPRWTHVDLTGAEFLALCERAARGECRLEQFGVGSRNGLWNAAVRERAQEVRTPPEMASAGTTLPGVVDYDESDLPW